MHSKKLAPFAPIVDCSCTSGVNVVTGCRNENLNRAGRSRNDGGVASIKGMFYPSWNGERETPRKASPRSSHVVRPPLHHLTFAFSTAFLKKGC